MPDILGMGRELGVVPEQAGQLEQGHLVALTEAGGVGDGGLQAGDAVPGVVADVAQENAGLGMLVDGVVQPEGNGLAGPVGNIIDGRLGDGGIDVITGPVEDDVVVQGLQGVQLRAGAGPGLVVALGAVGDGLAALGLDELLIQTVQHGDHIGVGAAAEVVVQDVELPDAHIIQLGQLGHQLLVALLVQGGVGGDVQAAEEAAQMDAPDIVALRLLADLHQLLDLPDVRFGVQVGPAAGMVCIGLGGIHIHVHLHIPGKLHQLGTGLIVPAAVEALDEAAVFDSRVVLDLCAQEDILLEGGQHHLQGRHAVVDRVGVTAHDGDLICLGFQHIGVVLFIEVCGVQGQGILIGIGSLAGAVDTQKDVEFSCDGLLRDGRGDPILFQDLREVGFGCIIDAGFADDIHLLTQRKLGAIVSDISYDGINVIDLFFLCFLCMRNCGWYVGKHQHSTKQETQVLLQSGRHVSPLLLRYVF